MAIPRNKLAEIMDFDFTALEALVGQPAGVDYNIGLGKLTRAPQTMEQVTDPLEYPWLLQTDGETAEDFQPCSQVNDSSQLLYLGYVRPDPDRYPGLSAPELRRGVVVDVLYTLDIDATRGSRVFSRDRRVEVFDDPLGEWSMFLITETVEYNRQIGS